MFQRLLVVVLLFSLTTSLSIAQTKPAKVKAEEVDAEAQQRREVAISLVTTLADAFTGEDSRIFSRFQTKTMTVVNNSTADEFDLLGVFDQLARADLLRAVQLAKTFTGEAPRAVATLAIARSVLEKRKQA